VLLEEVAFPGAISAFRSQGAELVGIPVDHQGMKVEVLEKILAWRKAKLIYTMPTFNNPTGTTMSEERRRKLLELSALYKIPIVEDQYANDLRLEGTASLPLAALDRHGWVIALGSFSKLLFQGLRVGWILSPVDAVRRRLIALKQAADLQTSYLAQGIILEFMQRGYLDKYLKRRLADLRVRRDAMRQAIRDFLPESASCYEIEGGICYWVRLPAPLQADEVLLESRKRGVVFAPKKLFSVNPSPNDAMRWGFTHLDVEEARHGVRIVGEVMHALLADSARAPAREEREYARAPL